MLDLRRPSSSRCSAARLRGRSRRARSNASAYGTSGVLMNSAADDPDGQARLTGFLQGLQEVGWTAGRNVRIDYRWAKYDDDRRRHAAELVALTPDVIMASASASVAFLQQASRTVPIVFASVTDQSARASSPA